MAHRLSLGYVVRQWAGSYVIACCVLSGLATGRLIIVRLLQLTPGTGVLLLALHVVAANAILAGVLLAPYSRASRLVAGLAGVSVSLLMTAGISAVMSHLAPGSITGGLLAIIPAIVLVGVALASVRKKRSNVSPVTPIVAAVLVLLALVGIVTEAGGVFLLVPSALGPAAMHAVWLSAMYTLAGFILQSGWMTAGEASRIRGSD